VKASQIWPSSSLHATDLQIVLVLLSNIMVLQHAESNSPELPDETGAQTLVGHCSPSNTKCCACTSDHTLVRLPLTEDTMQQVS
jgi:hypothetical protein